MTDSVTRLPFRLASATDDLGSSPERSCLTVTRPRPLVNRFGQVVEPRPLTLVVGRLLRCHSCDTVVDVLEAVLGARTAAEHQFLNPSTYLCGECLVASNSPSGGTK